MDNNRSRQNEPPQLFLVWLWQDEATGDGTGKSQGWHGKVQHVVTGKAHSFDSQASLMQLLSSIFPSRNSANAGRSNQADATDQFAPDSQQQDKILRFG